MKLLRDYRKTYFKVYLVWPFFEQKKAWGFILIQEIELLKLYR